MLSRGAGPARRNTVLRRRFGLVSWLRGPSETGNVAARGWHIVGTVPVGLGTGLDWGQPPLSSGLSRIRAFCRRMAEPR